MKARYQSLSPEARLRHIARVNARIKADPKRHVEYQRRAYWRKKLKAIEMLGGACVGCEETNPVILTVNHINGREPGNDKTGRDLYILVLEKGTDGFDLRCANCQMLWEYQRGVRSLPTTAEFEHLTKHILRGPV